MLDRLGIARHFEDIFDIAAADYVPKPDRTSYALMLRRHQVVPDRACMIEDIAVNLEPAKALGMATVWLKGEIEWARPRGGNSAPPSYIDHVADDLGSWLNMVLSRRAPGFGRATVPDIQPGRPPIRR
jgi:putative hydrolase of the HAD superfamily